MRMREPGSALNCFPPVRKTAYILGFFVFPEGQKLRLYSLTSVYEVPDLGQDDPGIQAATYFSVTSVSAGPGQEPEFIQPHQRIIPHRPAGVSSPVPAGA